MDLSSAWIKLVIGFGGALTLSACSSSPPPGVLTQADIPSYLGVRPNPSATAAMARQAGRPPVHCTTTGLVLFSVPGQRVDTSTRPPERTQTTPIILASGVSCISVSYAKALFKETAFSFPGASRVTGIGDEATLVNISDVLNRFYIVQWRDNNQGGLIWTVGPPSDKRITSGLAELLARRAAARS